MKILEARDGFIKVESNGKLHLSTFLQINDANKSYVAQIIQVKRFDEIFVAYAKILFLYDGSLLSYDKSQPSRKAEVCEFDFELLNNSLENKNPILAGTFIKDNVGISIDRSCFDKKMLISVDNKDSNKSIVLNLASQFLELGKVLIIDMLGVFEGQKFIAGVDFKLPLNTESLEFMYEDCLNDATSDSKSLIKDIFKDLADYSKTVPFLPFSTLKTIVDDMVDKSHIFKLLVLKNKLAKFDKEGYFAGNIKEAENLKNILSKNFVVIDLSKLDVTFQNRYLTTIYSLLNRSFTKTQVFVEASNSINKRSIKSILTSSVSSVFVTHSRFKFLSEVKSFFENYIIEPTFSNNEVFKIYSTFLNAMLKDTYLIVGEGTNYLPLISTISECNFELSEKEEIKPEHQDIKDLVVLEDFPKDAETVAIEKKSEALIDKIAEEVSDVSETVVSDLFSDDDEEESLIEELGKDANEEEQGSPLEDEINISIQSDDSLKERNLSSINESSGLEELSVAELEYEYHTQIDDTQLLEVSNEISILDENEPVEMVSIDAPDVNSLQVNELAGKEEGQETFDIEEELQIADSSEDAIESVIVEEEIVSENDALEDVMLQDTEVVESVEILDEQNVEQDDIEKQIIEDVDRVFTTMKEDTLSESDLDFIDELSNENIELGEDVIELSLSDGMEELTGFEEESNEPGFIEPLEEVGNEPIVEDTVDSQEILETRNAATPIVPVYDAEIPPEDLVVSDALEQGDTVVHVKYGNGVVEKMIKYGAKTLYSINFENVGRRLLDPTLQELKKA